MALEGPRNIGPMTPWYGRRIAGPIPPTALSGVTDTIKAHPWAIVAGVLFGAYALTKGWTPGSVWGGHRAAHS
ncbi:MAG: hypothetical protein ACREJC_21105, partial [Tepidisphaeraceae bacterium]